MAAAAAARRMARAGAGARRRAIKWTGKMTMPAWPQKTRELHNHHFDSTIWNDFRFRDDDIVIATYAKSGVAVANYRLPSAGADAAIQTDRGRVRAQGENVCIRWGTLNGGEEGCYRMTERRPGQYRIAEGALRWCELSSHRKHTANN